MPRSRAKQVAVVATDFDGILGAGDTDVQKALATLDGFTPIADHGELTGLGDNDHGAVYYTIDAVDALVVAIQAQLATHAAQHENDGTDELDVTGLSGLLADAQTPLTHTTTHENAGTDELDVTGLSGLLADAQTPLAHVTTHENTGTDELDVTGLSGLLADAQTPLAHALPGAHTFAGLTIGHVLRASAAGAASFAAIQAGDLPTGIDAAKIADGSVSNTEFQYLDDYSTIGLKDLTSGEVDQLENIGATTISAGQWVYVGAMDQGVAIGDSVTHANVYVPTAGAMGISGNETFVFNDAGTITVTGAHLHIAAGFDIIADGASSDVGSSGQLFDNVYATHVHVTAAGTELVYSSGAGILSLAGGTRVDVVGALLELEATTSTTGQITQGGTRILHTYGGTSNFFAGTGAGNFTMVGAVENTGVGYLALDALTSGDRNAGVGHGVLGACTGGLRNSALGRGALGAMLTGDDNVGVGHNVLASATYGNENTAVGSGALGTLTSTRDGCVALGYMAGFYETASSKLFIDNASRADEADGRVKALIYGVFDAATANQYLTVNAHLYVREDSLMIGAAKWQFNAATEAIYSAGAGILSLTAATRTEILGGPLYVGAGAPGHVITGAGDLFVADRLEVNGTTHFDSWAYSYGGFVFTAHSIYRDSTNLKTYGRIATIEDDGWIFGIGSVAGEANRHLIITDFANYSRDHDHDTLSANPTLFFHSVLNPDISNNQWGSLAWDTDGFVISTGANVGDGTVPTTNDNYIMFSPRGVEAARFEGDGGLLMAGAHPVRFNAATEYIASLTAGHIDVECDVSFDVNTILELEATTSTTGQITQGGTRILHTYGTTNYFAGAGAGNFTLTGASCVGVGSTVLDALTSGHSHTCGGAESGSAITTGHSNTAWGMGSLKECTTTSRNSAFGAYALTNNTGGDNTALGYAAGSTGNGSRGIYLGYRAGYYETGSDKLFIDNAIRASEADGRLKALIYGVFDAAVANQVLTVNGLLISSYGASFGDGAAATNQTNFSAAGRQTMIGTARVIRHHDIFVNVFKKVVGGSPPAEGLEGVFGTLDFDDGADEQMYVSFMVPYDWDSTTDIDLIIEWTFDANQADGAKFARFGAEYKSVATGEAYAGGTVTAPTQDSNGHDAGQGTRVLTHFATGIVAANLVAGETCGLRVYRDADNDDFVGDVRIVMVHPHYIKNSLGLAA